MDNKEGVWRTIRGRRVFIAKGESLGQAMAKSGKFKRSEIKSSRIQTSMEDTDKKILKNRKSSKLQHYKNKSEEKWTQGDTYHGNKITENQASKNRIHDDELVNEKGKTRVERNMPMYSDTDRREIAHENLQKRLADYKAKKQSNKKIQNDYVKESKEYTKNNASELSGDDYTKSLNKYMNEHGELGGKQGDLLIYNGDENEFYKAKLEHDKQYLAKKQSNNKITQGEPLKDLANDRIKEKQNTLANDKAMLEVMKRKGIKEVNGWTEKDFENRIKKNENYLEQSNNKIEDLKQKALNSKPNLYEQIHNEPTKEEMDYAIEKSNNKVETERELYERAKNNPESIDPMTENSTNWEALEKKYGKQETIKNYVEKKRTNNNISNKYSKEEKETYNKNYEKLINWEKLGNKYDMSVSSSGGGYGETYFTFSKTDNNGKEIAFYKTEPIKRLGKLNENDINEIIKKAEKHLQKKGK